jgi:hypothetical protein
VLLAFLLTSTFIVVATNASDLLGLQYKHAVTSGQVTRLVPAQHGAIEIRYKVAARDYIEILPPYGLSDPFVGEAVTVYYSPNDSQIASTAPPADVLAAQSPAWLAGALFMSVPITYALPQLGRQLDKLRWKKA